MLEPLAIGQELLEQKPAEISNQVHALKSQVVEQLVLITDTDRDCLEQMVDEVMKHSLHFDLIPVYPLSVECLQLVCVHSFRQDLSAFQVRLDNIHFELGRLLEAVSTGTLTFFGIDQPWLYLVAGIAIVSSLYNQAKVRLSENEAVCLLALWECQQENIDATLANIRRRANQHLKQREKPTLTKKRVEESLDRLIELRAVQREKDRFRVVERIIVRVR